MSINGSTPIDETGTGKPERKHGTAHLRDAQLHHAASLFDSAVFETNRIASQVQTWASARYFDRDEVDLTQVHDALTEAQTCMLMALHYATELHQLTCPNLVNEQGITEPPSFPTGFSTDEVPF